MFFGIEHFDRIKKIVRDAGFALREVPLIWLKEGGAFTDIEIRFMPRYESILFCSKGLRRINAPSSDVFEFNRPSTTDRIHTQQKSIGLIQRLVRLSTVPGEIVLDPCMGSGASIVGSIMSKRRAIGIELDMATFVKAKNWISGIDLKKIEDEPEIELEYV
jgi:DNA modification methylase